MKKKFSPLVICHLALMALEVIITIVSLIMILRTNKAVSLGICLGITNIAALVFGVIYILKGYTKAAANYYKAFIALLLINTFLNIVIGFNQEQTLRFALKGIKVLILFALVFGKNFGKRNTWILFSIMLVIDICLPFIYTTGNGTYTLIGVLSELLMDGTVGLAIRGKYADKDARGTV